MAKVQAVVNLYNTVLSGYSQCHSTGNKKKASGGWWVQFIELFVYKMLW